MAQDRVYNSSDSTQSVFSADADSVRMWSDTIHTSSLSQFQPAFSESMGNFSLSEMMEIGEGSQWEGKEGEGEKGVDVSLPLKQLHQRDGKPVKKAYFRIQLIRAFKKSLRQIATRKWAKAGIYKLNKNDEQHKQLWSRYYQCYKAEKAELSSDDLEAVQNNKEKCYNNQYCKRFFRSDAVRRLYFHFLDVTFREDSPPSDNCLKFRLQCCSGTHSERCTETWRAVKDFSRFGLFHDLGLKPWNGSQWASTADLNTEQFLALSDPSRP